MLEAIDLTHDPDMYLEQLDLLEHLISHNLQPPKDLLFIASRWEIDKDFQQFSIDFRFRQYMQLGVIFSRKEELQLPADLNTHYADLALDAYDQAIRLKPGSIGAWQAKYRVQADLKEYFDMINTIKEYIAKHSDEAPSRQLKVTLAEWVTAVEMITGYPKSTVEEYTEKVRMHPSLLSEVKEQYKVLKKLEHLFMQRLTPADKRLVAQLELLQQVIADDPI